MASIIKVDQLSEKTQGSGITLSHSLKNSSGSEIISPSGTVSNLSKLSLTPSSAPSSPVQGDMYLDSSDNQLKIYTGSFWKNIVFASTISATGGTVTETTDSGVNYRLHTFTTSGTFTVLSGSGNIEYLIVAGGGGGGGVYHAGGGGAGGLLNGTLSVTVQDYAITIGSGGGGGAASFGGGPSGVGSNGNNSTAFGLIAIGGGGGGTYPNNNYPGQSGGSGGGESGNGNVTNGLATTTNYGSGTFGQGNRGGNTYDTSWCGGGGGGGAGARGSDGYGQNQSPVNCIGGTGGIGRQFSDWASATSTGDQGYYAGGGGGSGAQSAGATFAGGLGGGGYGAEQAGGAGQVNTGGGGGGSERSYFTNNGTNVSNAGGNGGSGIVIIRYQI